MEWNQNWPYYVQGECMNNGTDSFLVFDLGDAEAVIKQRNLIKAVSPEEMVSSSEPLQAVTAMPQDWLSNFGSDYYIHTSTLAADSRSQQEWNVQDVGKPSPRRDSLEPTGEKALEKGITSIIATIKEGSIEHEPADDDQIARG
jgi:hypothetical protein